MVNSVFKYNRSILVLAVVYLLYYPVKANKPAIKEKPNIILIVADDLGWKDTGFMGSKFYETPNLDALAKQGLLFTHAYAAASNCAPSRACLLTGQNTPRYGVYTVGNADRGQSTSRKLIPVTNTEALGGSFLTISEVLQKAGYATAIIGKWHLGKEPELHGFDFNRAGTHLGHPPSYFSPYNISALPDGEPGEYLTDRLTTEAISFLDKPHKKPFFLYLPYYAVHTPLQAPETLKNKYKNKAGAEGQANATYAAMVESLDSNVGRILNKLDALQLTENTIIIFTSDNGGIRSVSSQRPLRAGKGSYYEGGIRVPLIIRWPNNIKANTQTSVPVTNLDFYPTFLDITGVQFKSPTLDGTSLVPLWQGKKVAERSLFWHFPIYLEAYAGNLDDARDPVFRTRPGAVIRRGIWKLHVYYEDNAKELYNLYDDPGERKNVASQNQDIVKKLYAALVNWQKQTKAPVPTRLNPDFDPALQFKVPGTRNSGKTH